MPDNSTPPNTSAQEKKSALAYCFANGLLLACLITFGKVFHQWWESGNLMLDAHTAFTFFFWFFGGAIIGWLSWRQKRAIAQHLERKAQEDQTPPK